MSLRNIHLIIIALLVRLSEPIEVSNDVPGANFTYDDAKLVFLSVVFRHGDRAPADDGHELYPNDPYINFDYNPVGLGGLTNVGKRRAYKLGAELRRKYNEFLGDSYIPNAVRARSTDYDRTKMTLMLVLSSLYPPKGNQNWNPNLNWQPIPISYVNKEDDILMIPEDCPLYIEELERVKNSDPIQKRLDKFQPIMKNLTHLTGKEIKTSNDMYYLYHTLMAESSMNLKLPKWTQYLFPNGPLWEGAILEYETTSNNIKLRRLYGGMLLRNIIDAMNKTAYRKIDDGRKINLFSGHETNVASLLQTLGVYDPHVPQYTSGVIIELLKHPENKYYVRIIHYLGIPAEMKVCRIPGCHEYCPLEYFIHLLKDVTPSDEEMMCPGKNINKKNFGS